LIVYYLPAIIPVIGWLVIMLVVLFGLGAELAARRQFYVRRGDRKCSRRNRKSGSASLDTTLPVSMPELLVRLFIPGSS
jgi:hypothetical protein